jgi:tRNA threonylcarbamoyladenosine biosynthesis protein TsaB
MLILAMESSAKPASVAVCLDGNLLGQYFQNSGLTHSRTLLAMAESLLKNLDISISDIGLIAVSSGPGSFTGIRIGVSAAKGMAWGLNIPVCGVSTLEAMAYQTPEQGMLLCPVMDARRNQVYNALFEWRGNALVRLCDDRAIALEQLSAELLERLSPNTSHVLPALFLIGDGAAISFEYLSNVGFHCKMASNLMRWQTAYGVALAACHAESIPAIELEPNYLRPSQAEREHTKTTPLQLFGGSS